MNEEHMAPILHLESSEERVREAQRNQARIDGEKIEGWNQIVKRRDTKPHNFLEGLVHSKPIHAAIQAETVRLDEELERTCSLLHQSITKHRRLMGALRDSAMRLGYAERENKWPLIELENKRIASLTPLEEEARIHLAGMIARWLLLYEPTI